MKVFTFIKQNLGLLFAPALILALGSCSSYQYSGYEADGIYGESRPGIWEQQEQPERQEVRPNNNNTYYKNLFAQQSEMYGEILESDIFTDVDSYSSTPSYGNYIDDQDGDGIAYSGGYAPWGNDPDTYTINIYNNGFYNPWYYGYGYGYGYYGYGYGYPYYRGWYGPGYYYPGYWNGYYSPMAYGYGSYWNFGFGFGWSYGYPYYNNYYYTNPYLVYGYYPHHRFDRVAYNATRRSEPVRYSEGTSRRNSISNARTNSYSRSIREIRNSRTSTAGTSRVRSSNDNGDVNIYSRTSRRTEASPIYNSRTNSGDSRTYQSRSRSSSNNTYRSSAPRRSSMPTRSTTTRSSSSSSRSSGTVRSSGGSRSSRGGRGGR